MNVVASHGIYENRYWSYQASYTVSFQAVNGTDQHMVFRDNPETS